VHGIPESLAPTRLVAEGENLNFMNACSTQYVAYVIPETQLAHRKPEGKRYPLSPCLTTEQTESYQKRISESDIGNSPKDLSISHSQHGCTLRICRFGKHCTKHIRIKHNVGHTTALTCVSPPDLNVIQTNASILRILEAEEDQNGGNSNTSVQRRGKDVVVLGPPREVASADDILKDESNKRPGDVVDGAGRRDQASSGEDDREAAI
jgi:hypothetical protein